MRTLFGLSLIVVFAVVLVGCSSSEPQSDGYAVPADVEQLLDDYRDAWSNQDVETFYASITDDFFYREYYYGTETHTLWKDWVVEGGGTPSQAAHGMEFRDPIELIEVRDVVVSGDSPWVVTTNEIWESDRGSYAFRWDGNFTRVIVEDAGTMKIASVVFAGSISEAEN